MDTETRRLLEAAADMLRHEQSRQDRLFMADQIDKLLAEPAELHPEDDPAALRAELDACSAEITRLRTLLNERTTTDATKAETDDCRFAGGRDAHVLDSDGRTTG